MNYFYIAIIVAGVIFLLKSIIIVNQSHVVLIERLGKYSRTLDSGLSLIVPIIDSPRPFILEGRSKPFVDLREQVIDFPPQPVITHDNVTMQVDSVIYFQVTNPIRAVYEVADLSNAIRQLAMTSLRNIMGELTLDQTLTSRETVNAKLRSTLDEATDKWGVKVNRVEIKNIAPPHEIEMSMQKQMKAERERRAMVTEAEGFRTSQVLKAEGERDAAIAEAEGRRQSQILDAQGRAQAILTLNQAEAQAIQMIYDAIHKGDPTPDLITIRYLETLKEMARGPANKVFIPYNAMEVLGSLGAIKETLNSAAVVAGAAPPARPAAPPQPGNPPWGGRQS
ncbi:MAG: hypothetical protein GMKNLPBB_02495 [Myxococcota bacterium]|nr:hypothetical protein [Myxococcota bacterium]